MARGLRARRVDKRAGNRYTALRRTCSGRKASNQLPMPALRVDGSVEMTTAPADAARAASATAAGGPSSARGGAKSSQ